MAESQGTGGRAKPGPANTGTLFDAALRSGISGVVRDRSGRPQVGALVELLNRESVLVARTFTDDRGRYSLPRLSAGWYQVEAGNTLFLPVLRPDLRLLANSRAIVNLTLTTASEALNWLPAQPRDPHSASDDWDWTLRLAANRPLLRFRDADGNPERQGEPVVVEDKGAASTRLEIRQGRLQFGDGGVRQQLAWRTTAEANRALLFHAEMSTAGGEPGRLSGTVAARQNLSADRFWTTVATVSDRPMIHAATGNGLTMLQVHTGSTMRLGDLATVSAGTEMKAARIGKGPATLANHPFATIALATGPTTVEYRISTAPATAESGLPDEAQDATAMVENNGRLAMEAGLHQQLRLSRKLGSRWTAEAALFDDTLEHPVVQGAVKGSEAAIDSDPVLYDRVLYDPGTGMIAVSGQGYHHGGVMGLLRDQLSPDTWLSLRYAMGDAESLAQPLPGVTSQAEPVFEAHTASSVTVAGGTRLPITHTAVHAGYSWQPVATVSAIAPFAGDREDEGAYLGLSIRQPIPLEHTGQGRLQAILDVRNLLAQGYRPFLSKDGTMVYFAQAQRCLAVGFAFSF